MPGCNCPFHVLFARVREALDAAVTDSMLGMFVDVSPAVLNPLEDIVETVVERVLDACGLADSTLVEYVVVHPHEALAMKAGYPNVYVVPGGVSFKRPPGEKCRREDTVRGALIEGLFSRLSDLAHEYLDDRAAAFRPAEQPEAS